MMGLAPAEILGFLIKFRVKGVNSGSELRRGDFKIRVKKKLPGKELRGVSSIRVKGSFPSSKLRGHIHVES